MIYWGERPSPYLVNFVTMLIKRPYPILFLIIIGLTLASLALQQAPNQLQAGTPTGTPFNEKATETEAPLETQAGGTDGILLLGLIQITFILIPILTIPYLKKKQPPAA